jgi:SAM-dependent methyltransferase
MHVDWMFGPAAPERGWVPAPRYLMRRSRILALTRELPSGDLLEVGCGAGMLLHEFARRGFRCTALESSAAALSVATTLAQEVGIPIEFFAAPRADWDKKFATILAFEVLEHIEDDRGALARWVNWLQPGGHLVLSVPAHARGWSAGDEWAGHYRRYERANLVRLVADAGLQLEEFECYGYPATNVGERLSSRSYARRIDRSASKDENGRRSNNDRSGVERGPHVKIYPLLRTPLGRIAIAACIWVQQLFLGTDLGSGYVLRARRL